MGLSFTQQPVFNNTGYNYALPTLTEQRAQEAARVEQARSDYNTSVANTAYRPITNEYGEILNYEAYNPATGETVKPFEAPKPITPAASGIPKPITNLGTNPGNQTIAPRYNTTSPTQSSYYWGSQTSGNGTTPQPVNQAPAQAWGTGNQGIIPQFNVDNFIQQMLSPNWQAAAQQTTPQEYGTKL